MPSSFLGFLYTLPEEFFRHANCPCDAATAAQTGALEQRSENNARDVTISAQDVDSDSVAGSTCLTCGIGGWAMPPNNTVESPNTALLLKIL